MDFAGYRSDALGAAVDLVNAVTTAPADAPAEPHALRAVLLDHGYLAEESPEAAEAALAAWARRLRTVFDAPDLAATAVAINALLADVRVEPHLSDHDGLAWHLHYSPPEADVVDRARSTTAFALALLVSTHGMDRHGSCAAAGCRRVFADTSRNAARRYCSPACANRSAVAAHRARVKAAGSA